MITAKNAILQGRDVYAVPGNIDDENSSGTNMLIRDGAQAVLCGNDIVRNYAYMYRDTLDVAMVALAEKKSGFDATMRSMSPRDNAMPVGAFGFAINTVLFIPT